MNKENKELIMSYIVTIREKFNSYVSSMTLSTSTTFKATCSPPTQLTDKLNELLQDGEPFSVELFANIKYILDKLFYELTEQGIIQYTYHEEALINAEQLEKELDISNVVLLRYVEHGLEAVFNSTTNEYQYPIHNKIYWSDGLMASRVQVLYLSYKLRNRTTEDVIEELKKEISTFERSYNGTFNEVFKEVSNPDSLDEPNDYYDWKDALDELKELTS